MGSVVSLVCELLFRVKVTGDDEKVTQKPALDFWIHTHTWIHTHHTTHTTYTYTHTHTHTRVLSEIYYVL